MSLCGPPRCGCAYSSDTLTLSGSGQPGDPLQIETYQGVATEIPDTRPAPGARFEGMRVHCTDTDRTFLWDGTNWRCISQPLKPVGLSSSWGIGDGTEAAGYSRFGHQVMVQYECSLGAGFSIGLGFFVPPVAAAWGPNLRHIGYAGFYDVSTGIVYHGSCDLNVADSLIRLYCPHPFHFQPEPTGRPFAWAAGDQMWFKLVYDAAANV